MSSLLLPIQSSVTLLLNTLVSPLIIPSSRSMPMMVLMFSDSPLSSGQLLQIVDVLKEFMVCGAVVISLIVTLVIVGREIQNAVIITARQSHSRKSAATSRGEWMSGWR